MKRIKVLGVGCSNCRKTHARIAEVAQASGVEIVLEKVEDLAEIADYRLLTLPGVVVDGELVHMGGVPERAKILGWLGTGGSAPVQEAVAAGPGHQVPGEFGPDAHTSNPRYRTAVLLVVVLAAIAVFFLRPGAREAAPVASSTVAAGLPALVDLGALSCVPCRMMAPILDALRDDYAGQFAVEFIDVSIQPDQAERYGVRMIPAQIFFDAEGRELFRHFGYLSREQILGRWQRLGYAFDAPVDTGTEAR